MATKELIEQLNKLPEEKLEAVEKLVKELLEESLFTHPGKQNSKAEDVAHITKGLEEVKKIRAGDLPKKKIEDLLRGF